MSHDVHVVQVDDSVTPMMKAACSFEALENTLRYMDRILESHHLCKFVVC
jgi:hypothetical protein